MVYHFWLDFILEMFSIRYVNIFVFLLFISTGLTVFYSFRLFYFVLCGDFNFCGLVVRVSGYRYRGLGFDSRRYQIF